MKAVQTTIRLLNACVASGAYWSIENPLLSGLWAHSPLLKFLAGTPHEIADLDMCSFGAFYKKPTRIIGSLPGLSSLGQRCSGGHTHERLAGTIRVEEAGTSRQVFVTSLAGRYPPPLCRQWARIAKRVLPTTGSARNGFADMAPWEAALCAARNAGVGSHFVPTCPAGCPREWPRDPQRWDFTETWIPPRAHSLQS